MNFSDVEVAVLSLAVAVFIVYAMRLRHRLQASEDFILARRRLGHRLAAVGVAMNGVPIWWLLLIAGTAYVSGLSAVWLALVMVCGIAVTGWTIAPRLRSRAQMQQCNTITQLLAGDAGEKMYGMLM